MRENLDLRADRSGTIPNQAWRRRLMVGVWTVSGLVFLFGVIQALRTGHVTSGFLYAGKAAKDRNGIDPDKRETIELLEYILENGALWVFITYTVLSFLVAIVGIAFVRRLIEAPKGPRWTQDHPRR